jgi:hypothetical protein
MFSQLDRNTVGHPVRMMELRGNQSGVFGSRQLDAGDPRRGDCATELLDMNISNSRTNISECKKVEWSSYKTSQT